MLQDIFRHVGAHERKMGASFSLVPSENMLSPLARWMLLSDAYSRYCFQDDSMWGSLAFPGGRQINALQKEILWPSLQRLSGARFVDMKGISGLNNMILSLAAYCTEGDKILCVPEEMGGHASTQHVAKQLALTVEFLPVKDSFSFDPDRLVDILSKNKITLIYVDQANVLFPLDVEILRQCVDSAGSDTKIHIDTSHTNGLIFGRALENPLERGADSYGGSLHKSFPGPHKAFIATNSQPIYLRFCEKSAHLVSHQHAADILALAVTLAEFESFDGKDYAGQIVKNARFFAEILSQAGLQLAATDRNYTATHQIWVGGRNMTALNRLYDAGFIVNAFGRLPVFPDGGLRLGLNEMTRLSVCENDLRLLALLFCEAINSDIPIQVIQEQVSMLRRKYSEPKYCFSQHGQNVNDVFSQVVAHVLR